VAQWLIGIIVVLAIAFGLIWGVLTIYRGMPQSVEAILLRNYMIAVVFPIWAIGCWVLVSAFDAIRENAFEIEFLTLKFKGSVGLVVSWILSTMLGWLIIGKFWNNG
jgi:hypothetical protein